MTIAIDFDGCLCTRNWPGIGEPNWDAIHELIRRKAEGDKLILWTCRDGQQLEEAVQWCYNHGLKFDAVNENLPAHRDYFGNDTRKVYADEYWDDKAVTVLADQMNPYSAAGTTPAPHEEPLKKKPGFFRKLLWRVRKA